MLRHLGYSATLCDSGESAISLLKDRNFDLIMLDMIMAPGIDGLDTYQEIRKIRPGTPTIIVSGYAQTERIKQALQLGVKLHFKKPYSIRDLGSIIKSLIK
jgi:CheY-like chemotaxis protein